MKGLAALLAAALLSMPVAAQSEQEAGLTLSEPVQPALVLTQGATIDLMVLTEVSSGRAKVGDLVKLRVNAPVMLGDDVVIPVGTLAYGKVDLSQQSAGALQRGSLSVSLTHIALGDQRISLLGAFDRRGKGGKNDDAVKMLLAPMYVLFSPGNSAKLKAGDLVVGRVGETYQVERMGGTFAFHGVDDATAP